MEILTSIELIVGLSIMIIGAIVAVWKLTNRLVITLNNLNITTAQLSQHLKETRTDIEELKDGYNNHEVRLSVLEQTK